MGVKVRRPKGYASWCVVIDHNGRRTTKAVGSREAAERVRREIEVRLALGQTATPGSEKRPFPTLDAYSKTWLSEIEDGRKPSTVGFYAQYLRL
jgi:hypothetical protein